MELAAPAPDVVAEGPPEPDPDVELEPEPELELELELEPEPPDDDEFVIAAPLLMTGYVYVPSVSAGSGA